MKKLLLSLVFALALTGGLVAALSSIVNASPAQSQAHSCTAKTC
jgi:hypothetical protein